MYVFVQKRKKIVMVTITKLIILENVFFIIIYNYYVIIYSKNVIVFEIISSLW